MLTPLFDFGIREEPRLYSLVWVVNMTCGCYAQFSLNGVCLLIRQGPYCSSSVQFEKFAHGVPLHSTRMVSPHETNGARTADREFGRHRAKEQ